MEIAENAPIAPPARRRRPSIIVPVILIGLGALFLAQNLGWIASDAWLDLWRFWPVLLVLVGVEVMFGRSTWASAIAAVVVIVLVGSFVAFANFVGYLPREASDWGREWWTGPAVTAGVEEIAEEIGDVRESSIDLRHSAGRLVISALPTDSSQLIAASLEHSDGVSIYKSIERRNGTAEVRLREATESDWPFRRVVNLRADWTIQLSPKVKTDLRIQTGASSLDLDLRELQVTQLDVEAGASGVNVTLPEAAGHTTVRIKAGAAGVEVTVPEGVAARIRAQSGLGGLSIDQDRFPKSGRYYESPNFDSARNRVEIEVETGVSGVTIR